VSELRKIDTGTVSPRLKAWAARSDAETFFLSVICVLELELSALLIERRDRRQGAMIRAWLDRKIMPEFSGRILPITFEIARRCATLHVPNPKPYAAALIAATALVHGMTVVTRNISDFESTGVTFLNPWEP